MTTVHLCNTTSETDTIGTYDRDAPVTQWRCATPQETRARRQRKSHA